MIIRSFAELRPHGRILRVDPPRSEAEVLAERAVRKSEREREQARNLALGQFLPDKAEVRPERFQIPGKGKRRWTPPEESVSMRTGAQLGQELPPVPEPPDNRLLNSPIKRRSIRKVPNGGRLKLTGAAHGAYRFHPNALGES
jgi:hypothetical protein